MLLPDTSSLELAGPIARYREQGFAALGPIASEEGLRRLRARADEIMRGEVVHEGLFFQHDAATGRYDDVPRGQGWQGPSLRYRKIEKLERDPLFREWLENPLFGRIARELLGPRVLLCRAVLFTKAAQGGTQLPWHQDGGSFWGLSKQPILQIWTALDDAPIEAGCVELVPKSHLDGLATPLGGVVPDDVFERSGNASRTLLQPAKAGEAMLIHNLTWHRSGVNRTAEPRRALTICFMDAETKCVRRRSPRQFLPVFGG